MPIFNVNTEAPPRKLPVLNASYPQDVTLVASASGSATFQIAIAEDGKPAEYSYQWYVNGTAVSGANAATYTRTGLTAAATYNVYCAVTNKAGTVNSRTATLTVQSYLPTYTYTGSHELVDEGNYKWKIYFYSSGTLTITHLGSGAGSAQGFCCGGGGGGGKHSGGGGGYTKTGNITLALNTKYVITVGAGGTHDTGTAAGTSSIAVSGGSTLLSAGGGISGTGNWGGGDGGSGGGGYAENYHAGNGGSNGSNGGNGDYEDRGDGEGGEGGKGQGTTTREFGESSGTLYAGGGGGESEDGASYDGKGGAGGGGNAWSSDSSPGSSGTNYLGGGGGAAGYHKGGIGRVAIRNRR